MANKQHFGQFWFVLAQQHPENGLISKIYLSRWVKQSTVRPWGVLLGILSGGVLPGSLNLDPISVKKMSFSTPFSDLASKIHARFPTWR